MKDRISITVEEGVADVRLIRSDKMNALDSRMFDAIEEAGEQLRADSDIRVVVLSGEGRAFCAGLDMANMGDMLSGDLTADSAAEAYDELSPAGANRVQRLGWGWQEVSIPVIAAVQGAAMGGGLNLALGADIRVVAPGAKLGFVEISFGLLPDMSATQSLRHLVGLERAKELILTGRRFTGAQAYEYGLATTLSDTPGERAMAMARTIALRSQWSSASGKPAPTARACLSERAMSARPSVPTVSRCSCVRVGCWPRRSIPS